jgi:hypothetical protein
MTVVRAAFQPLGGPKPAVPIPCREEAALSRTRIGASRTGGARKKALALASGKPDAPSPMGAVEPQRHLFGEFQNVGRRCGVTRVAQIPAGMPVGDIVPIVSSKSISPGDDGDVGAQAGERQFAEHPFLQQDGAGVRLARRSSSDVIVDLPAPEDPTSATV